MCSPDHVHPRYRGGLRDDENLVASCWIDNTALKGHLPAEKALGIIRRRVSAGTHPHQVYQRTGIWMFTRGQIGDAYRRAALQGATSQPPGA